MQVPRGWTRTMFFGCLHAPVHDHKKLKGLLALIREMSPDRLVLLGDLLDMDAASRFVSEQKWTLQDELDSADEILDRLAEAGRNADLEYMFGNHEDNRTQPGRIPEKIRSLTDPEKHMKALLKWRVTPHRQDEKGLRRWGQVTATHGWDAGLYSDNKETLMWGVENGLHVRVHTHRNTRGPVQARAGTVPIPKWYVNAGTMCDIEFFKEKHYGRRINTQGWGFAPVIVDADEKATATDSRRWQCSQYWFDQF